MKRKTKSLIESDYFDFLNQYSFDERVVEMFKKEKGMNFKGRHHSQIYHRNFFVVLALKRGYLLTTVGNFFHITHATINHALGALVENLQNGDLICVNARIDVLKFFEKIEKEYPWLVFIDEEKKVFRDVDNEVFQMMIEMENHSSRIFHRSSQLYSSGFTNTVF